ncbi:MAG TPA: dTDP-4-dehydrorhamnose 3,5-epimerase family protein [Burkholderiaceae bacterium]|nr:dTDP-4-dehydrorhamnose 3,5-epimerase family protein [Burkholderiaceae bacterium]
MIFEATAIRGAFVVRPERRVDERGFFARVWCRDEFAAQGIAIDIVQASVSHNRRAGTLRGLHYSLSPAQEGKLVRCERGRIHDVLVDLRVDGPSYLQHVALELDDVSRDAVYIPPGVAHGFQTLVDDCQVLYMMSDVYRPELATGVRFDDPAFGLRWPLPVSVIAERDRDYADYARAVPGTRA